MTFTRRWVVALLAPVVLAGCGGGDTDDGVAAAVTAPTTGSAAPSTTAAPPSTTDAVARAQQEVDEAISDLARPWGPAGADVAYDPDDCDYVNGTLFAGGTATNSTAASADYRIVIRAVGFDGVERAVDDTGVFKVAPGERRTFRLAIDDAKAGTVRGCELVAATRRASA